MKLLVPLTRSLLQAIDGLAKSANLGFLTRRGETFRLHHIDLFVEVAIEESGLNVHGVDFPVFQGGKRKKEVKRLEASNRREGFIIVNTMSLRKAFSNKVSVIATIRFVLEDPFVAD